jgi:hypothetical protein
MSIEIKQIFDKAEGRYLEERETEKLLVYADGILSGVESLQAIERAEAGIIDDVVLAVTKKHASLNQDYGKDTALRVRRDQTLVLRYAAFSMLLQDKSFIYDKLAVWLRTILFALCKPEEVLFGYYSLVDACRRHLTKGDSDALIPYIQVLIDEFEANGGKPS